MYIIVGIHLTYFQWVEHTLAGDNDLFGLLLHRKGADEGSHFLCRLPFGQLTQSLLPRPHRGVNDLQEKLPGTGVEDENGSVDGLCGEIAFKCLERERERERGGRE